MHCYSLWIRLYSAPLDSNKENLKRSALSWIRKRKKEPINDVLLKNADMPFNHQRGTARKELEPLPKDFQTESFKSKSKIKEREKK